MSFNTLNEMKNALRIPLVITDYDDDLNSLLDVIHGSILSDVGGGLLSALQTQYTASFDIPSAGFRGIRLPKWPVSSVTSVSTGTNAGSAGTLLDSTSYYSTDEGTLRLQGELAWWPPGVQNVTVVWQAGVAGTSLDPAYKALKLAERISVAEVFNTLPAQGKHGERIGNYVYNGQPLSKRGGGTYPRVAQNIINKYRTIIPTAVVIP